LSLKLYLRTKIAEKPHLLKVQLGKWEQNIGNDFEYIEPICSNTIRSCKYQSYMWKSKSVTQTIEYAVSSHSVTVHYINTSNTLLLLKMW
jgi:hypothetical protein